MSARLRSSSLLLGMLLVSIHSPALADFVNGGFEAGTFTGWTVEFATVKKTAGLRDFTNWTTTQGGHPNPLVRSGTNAAEHVFANIYPYCDGFMAQINDKEGSQDATRIKQTATLTAQEVNCSQVKVHWGTVLCIGDGHNNQEQAFFEIVVKVNGNKVDEFTANANDATAGNGWTCMTSGNRDFCYKDGSFVHHLNGVAVGDQVEVIMTVADCTQSEHGAFAFLDCVAIDSPCDRPCSEGNKAGIPRPTIPNVFTPNGDGINDFARVTHIQQACYLKYEIFDAWGLKMFDDEVYEPLGFADGTYAGWNGKVESTGADVPEGTYYYVITARNCSDSQVWTGFMSLFR